MVYVIVFSMVDGILMLIFIVKCMEVVDEELKKVFMVGFIILGGVGFFLSVLFLFGKWDVI